MIMHAHSEIVQASPSRSSWIRHLNALTERAWKDAVQGLGDTYAYMHTAEIWKNNFFSLIFSEKAFFIIKSGLLFWFGFVQLANPRKTYLLVYSRGYLICTNDQFPKSRCQLRLLKQKVSIVFVCNCKKKSSHLHAFSR